MGKIGQDSGFEIIEGAGGRVAVHVKARQDQQQAWTRISALPQCRFPRLCAARPYNSSGFANRPLGNPAGMAIIADIRIPPTARPVLRGSCENFHCWRHLSAPDAVNADKESNMGGSSRRQNSADGSSHRWILAPDAPGPGAPATAAAWGGLKSIAPPFYFGGAPRECLWICPGQNPARVLLLNWGTAKAVAQNGQQGPRRVEFRIISKGIGECGHITFCKIFHVEPSFRTDAISGFCALQTSMLVAMFCDIAFLSPEKGAWRGVARLRQGITRCRGKGNSPARKALLNSVQVKPQAGIAYRVCSVSPEALADVSWAARGQRQKLAQSLKPA